MPNNGDEKFEVRIVQTPYKNMWLKVLPDGRLILQGKNSQTEKGYGIGLPRHIAHDPKKFQQFIMHYVSTGEISPLDLVPDDAEDANIVDEDNLSVN